MVLTVMPWQWACRGFELVYFEKVLVEWGVVGA